MPNREYVIGCLKYLHDKKTWKEGPLVFDDHAEDRRRITANALALLREQEPVRPELRMSKHGFRQWLVCGDCHEAIDFKDRFCRHCGRRAKWDE